MLKITTLIASFMIASTLSAATGPYAYITIGSDAVAETKKSIMMTKSTNLVSFDGEVSVMKIHKSMIPRLSSMMHESFFRCGGFMVHDSEEEAVQELMNASSQKANIPLINYTIDQEELAEKLVAQVEEMNIRKVIEKLSSYKNRYYKADTGVSSQEWLKSHWESISSHRNDVKVELFKHSKWPQPSVILTLEGSSKADEIVIIGGHGDSIAGMFMQQNNKAPGADDNASGIASITEVIRVALQNNYRPQRTIKFISYAAEEVGLLGSKEIAQLHKKDSQNVVGVVQLDMTNFKGTRDLDIVFMTDYTNKDQNEFMGKLIDRYVKVPWGYSKCGYGCSDHASWHSQGFPASMPFESTMKDINKKIHTSKDVLDNSDGHAFHAQKFAKLATAYLVEMGK